MRGTYSFPYLFLLFFTPLLWTACTTKEPLEQLVSDLKHAPDYSIILQDMKEEGFLFPDYFHKYKIIQDSKEKTTEWLKVSEQFYRRNQNFLGMTLVAKSKDGINTTPAPPGFHHIGDERYGQWRTDERGNSFWEFYGKYALFRDALSMIGGAFGGGRLYRRDYDNFRDYNQTGRPYYGPRHEYGTTGSYTKKSNPSFFERRKTQMRQKRTAFANKARSRMGRSRMSFSRGRGFGK